jgi:divalent metal cation (Fe/Co/Zn/Cd) transporter
MYGGRMKRTAAHVPSPALLPAPDRRAVLDRRVRLIVAATITYNVVEAAIAIFAGAIASSTALIAFGLDSVVEVLSAGAVAWQYSARVPAEREHVALRLVAASFFGLAAFVTFDAVRHLLGSEEAAASPVGIALAAASVVIMPGLSWLERRTGRELHSASVIADSKQTLICACLSAVLLVGLVVHATLGWAWADPAVALVIAAVAVREGRAALRGDTCCGPPAALLVDEDAAVDPCSGPSTEPSEELATDACCPDHEH